MYAWREAACVSTPCVRPSHQPSLHLPTTMRGGCWYTHKPFVGWLAATVQYDGEPSSTQATRRIKPKTTHKITTISAPANDYYDTNTQRHSPIIVHKRWNTPPHRHAASQGKGVQYTDRHTQATTFKSPHANTHSERRSLVCNVNAGD